MPELQQITSRQNQRLKQAKSVRDGKSADRIFVEGLRLCEEALRSGVKATECFVTRRFAQSERGMIVIEGVITEGSPVFELSESNFDSIADTKNSQGVVVISERPGETDLSAFPGAGKLPIIIYLESVNNPSNLGAIMRIAEAAGVNGIITSAASADPFSPKSLRASMGSAFRLQIRQHEEFKSAVDWAAKSGLLITAAAGEGTIEYTEIDWNRPRLLIFGSEGHGLTDEQLLSVNERVRIPMEKSVESLNLAVACGIMLFEARRQLLS